MTEPTSDVGWSNGLQSVLEETERVGLRIDAQLADEAYPLYALMGMIPNATRRIITEITEQTARDHAALFHASRFFNSATGAFLLLRRGMVQR